jgi:hypothetical protein
MASSRIRGLTSRQRGGHLGDRNDVMLAADMNLIDAAPCRCGAYEEHTPCDTGVAARDLAARRRPVRLLGDDLLRVLRPAGPDVADLHTTRAVVAGAFSVGLLVMALAAPQIGRWVDRIARPG